MMVVCLWGRFLALTQLWSWPSFILKPTIPDNRMLGEGRFWKVDLLLWIQLGSLTVYQNIPSVSMSGNHGNLNFRRYYYISAVFRAEKQPTKQNNLKSFHSLPLININFKPSIMIYNEVWVEGNKDLRFLAVFRAEKRPPKQYNHRCRFKDENLWIAHGLLI